MTHQEQIDQIDLQLDVVTRALFRRAGRANSLTHAGWMRARRVSPRLSALRDRLSAARGVAQDARDADLNAAYRRQQRSEAAKRAAATRARRKVAP